MTIEGKEREGPCCLRVVTSRSGVGEKKKAPGLGSAPSQEAFWIGSSSATSRGPAPARALPRAHPKVAAAAYAASFTAYGPRSQTRAGA